MGLILRQSYGVVSLDFLYYIDSQGHIMNKSQRIDGLNLIGYIRVSTQEQAEHGVSLADQRSRLHAKAEAIGANLIHVYEDAGISGAKGRADRPGYDACLSALENGEADGLIVISLDRFGRSGLQTAAAIDTITSEWKKRFICLDFMEGKELDTEMPGTEILLAVQSIFAKMSRTQSNERVRSALQHKKANGLVYTHTSYGKQRRGDKLHNLAPEQAIIKRITALHGTGTSERGIAAVLNVEGITAKRGGSWSGRQIGRVLVLAGAKD